jgi:uncharacterized membrane protein YozB (DUF420 family)
MDRPFFTAQFVEIIFLAVANLRITAGKQNSDEIIKMNYLDLFPHLNAFLNGLSGILLAIGFYFIKQKKVQLHRIAMFSAVCLSAVFLVSYVSSKVIFGIDSVKFTGQ